VRDGWAEAARNCHSRGEDVLQDDEYQSSERKTDKSTTAIAGIEPRGFLAGIDTEVIREEDRV